MPAEDFANASRLSQVLARTAFLPLAPGIPLRPHLQRRLAGQKRRPGTRNASSPPLDTGNALSPLPLALRTISVFRTPSHPAAATIFGGGGGGGGGTATSLKFSFTRSHVSRPLFRI